MDEKFIYDLILLCGCSAILEDNGVNAEDVIDVGKLERIWRLLDVKESSQTDEDKIYFQDLAKRVFVEAVDRLLVTEVSE